MEGPTRLLVKDNRGGLGFASHHSAGEPPVSISAEMLASLPAPSP